MKGWFSGGGRNPKALLADRYLLGEPIGAGAMAEVFIAHDKTLSRDVAVKILRSQYASEPEFLERFRREATLRLDVASKPRASARPRRSRDRCR